MDKIVPLPSQLVVGPMKLAHLPRLWLKSLLGAAGLLPEGYIDYYLGSNQSVVDAIGLDPEATFAFLKTKPQYRDFETWVRANAKNLNAESIAASNATIHAQIKPADKAAAVRADVGLTDDSIGSSPLLNALDDWYTVHRAIVANIGKPIQPIVPALSSQSAGPLGLEHLPRLWLKATLNKAGALYDGWKSGEDSGFDQWFSGQVGIDLPAMIAYIHAELPPYLVLESWFAERATNISPEAMAQHNATMEIRVKPDHIAAEERLVLGIDDTSYKLSREMNDLVDWLQLHEQISRA